VPKMGAIEPTDNRSPDKPILPKALKRGRPTILNLNKAYEVVHAIVVTGSIEGASALSGIARRTYYNWLRYGERMAVRQEAGYRLAQEDEIFAILYRNVMDELARLERHNFELVKHAADAGVWQAAAWTLERRFPERWGRRGLRNGPPVHISTDRVTINEGKKASDD